MWTVCPHKAQPRPPAGKNRAQLLHHRRWCRGVRGQRHCRLLVVSGQVCQHASDPMPHDKDGKAEDALTAHLLCGSHLAFSAVKDTVVTILISVGFALCFYITLCFPSFTRMFSPFTVVFSRSCLVCSRKSFSTASLRFERKCRPSIIVISFCLCHTSHFRRLILFPLFRLW
ncbi:hypothetical protein ABB37_00981 [Leptomonas pyrrhocoris]|uniref:Transmembrane protein n=1 Tax=Leptomonas pyrrhocoris TaxID=157538 RepID=A0A0N0VHZ9_LEPPY|nr:hypothetical protein ABB37_00981 [Leptomonas pyrrhocoris]KPA86958.1 hypothetical protein ABB37_00981 [Leptomonas pyrrhocoris]|eukprot:XP_015665397.1 hypothetical protein ABB37_00981 [Leptomonas pyrrhocoris]